MRAAVGVNEPDIVFRDWVLREDSVAVDTYRSLVCLRFLNEVYVTNSTYDEAAEAGGPSAANPLSRTTSKERLNYVRPEGRRV